ncbi:hypothetical protein [Hyphomonas sp.]|jgi:hypothetical protein
MRSIVRSYPLDVRDSLFGIAVDFFRINAFCIGAVFRDIYDNVGKMPVI